MNTSTTITGVERVNVGDMARLHSPEGVPYFTRTLVCHGGGRTVTLVLHSRLKSGLQMHFHPDDLDACLKGLSVEQLDSLANAVRAERQSRDTAGEVMDAAQILLDPDQAAMLPRDCAPVGLPASGEMVLVTAPLAQGECWCRCSARAKIGETCRECGDAQPPF